MRSKLTAPGEVESAGPGASKLSSTTGRKVFSAVAVDLTFTFRRKEEVSDRQAEMGETHAWEHAQEEPPMENPNETYIDIGAGVTVEIVAVALLAARRWVGAVAQNGGVERRAGIVDRSVAALDYVGR